MTLETVYFPLVQQLLGHADAQTTASYIGLGEDDHDTARDDVRY